jgi:LCP family protein required for cell wall assembly
MDKNRRTNKKKKHRGLKILVFLLIIIAILGGIFAKKIYDLQGNWLAAIMGHNKETLKNLDRISLLVLGESGENTDTIIIFSYDPKIQSASMLSIPRDTFIGENTKNARVGDKINSLYTHGESSERTLEAVNKLTGLNIPYYVLVDTEVLKELVNIIGGLDFDVPIDMKYSDYSQDLFIDLEAGYQKLSGEQVEHLVRFRHNQNGSTYSYDYGIEDYGRMRTQREVIKAIAAQTIKFKNIKEIGNIIDVLNKYVTTNMDLSLAKDYIPYGVNIDTETIKTEQLPGESVVLNGIWFFLNEKEETETIVNDLFYENSNENPEDVVITE